MNEYEHGENCTEKKTWYDFSRYHYRSWFGITSAKISDISPWIVFASRSDDYYYIFIFICARYCIHNKILQAETDCWSGNFALLLRFDYGLQTIHLIRTWLITDTQPNHWHKCVSLNKYTFCPRQILNCWFRWCVWFRSTHLFLSHYIA